MDHWIFYWNNLKEVWKLYVRFCLKKTSQGLSKESRYSNVRRTRHIIDYIQKQVMRAVLVGLDAEKAFDSVYWKCLYQVLDRWGFQKQPIKGIQTFYQERTIRIKINGHLTPWFSKWGPARGRGKMRENGGKKIKNVIVFIIITHITGQCWPHNVCACNKTDLCLNVN